jgi:hypothetical protein
VMRAERERKSLKELERHRFLYVPKANSQAIRSKTSREAKKGRLARKLSGIFPPKRRRKEMRMERTSMDQSINNLARNRQKGVLWRECKRIFGLPICSISLNYTIHRVYVNLILYMMGKGILLFSLFSCIGFSVCNHFYLIRY